jgi:hypothetical protein
MIGESILQRPATKPHVATPGRQHVEDGQTDFSAGLNITSVEDALGEAQFRRGDNVRLLPYGAVAKRGGTQRTAAQLVASKPVRNGFTWLKADGTRIIMAVCDGHLFRTTYGSFPLTWTLVAGSLVADFPATSRVGSVPQAFQPGSAPCFQPFLDTSGAEVTFIADGGLLNKYDGTTFTPDIPTTALCTQIAVHNERLWGVGDPAHPQSVFYSALNKGDTLGNGALGGGEIIVRTFGNQRTTAVISIGTSLLVFHTTGVSRITGFGQDDIAVQPAGISSHVGTIAPFSVVNVNNVAFFVTMRGLYMANEQQVIPVSTPEKPDPLSQLLSGLSALDISEIRCELHRATRELLIWVPGFGVFVYHTILQSWAGPWMDGYVLPATVSMWEAGNADGYPIVLVGDESGYVKEMDRLAVGLDNVNPDGTGGILFTMAFQPRRYFCQQPHVAKAWRWAYVLASMAGSDAAALSYQTDSAASRKPFSPSSASTWGAPLTRWGAALSVWGASGQISHEFDIHGWGYGIDITISDSSPATPIISQIAVEGFALGRR